MTQSSGAVTINVNKSKISKKAMQGRKASLDQNNGCILHTSSLQSILNLFYICEIYEFTPTFLLRMLKKYVKSTL